MKRSELSALLLIMAVGAALRLLGLDQGLRIDELEAWAAAQRPPGDILFDLNRPPHVSSLVRAAEGLLGRGEALLRLPFALYGVLTLPLVYLIGRELFDGETGLLASLLLAASAFHIAYCQEPRYYAPFTFYSMCGFYCALRLMRRGEPSWTMAAALAGLALPQLLNLYLHRLAVFPLALCAAPLAWGLARRGSAKGSAWLWAAAGGVALIFAAVYAPQWRWLFDRVGRQLRGSLTLRMSYLTWHYRDPRGSVAWEILSAFSGGRGPALLLLVAGAAGQVARGKPGLRREAPLLAWLALPLLSLAVVRTRTHFELRYFIFMLPAWLVWAAAGLRSSASLMATRRARAALLVLAAAVLALEAPALAALYRLPKSRLREAFAHVSQGCSPGEAVVAYPAWETLWYGYYPLKDGCRLLPPANLLAGSPAFAPEGVLRAGRVWLMGTWTLDPARAKEFGQIRGILEKACELEAARRFESRDPNDDHLVLRFRCGGFGRRAPPAAVPRPRATPASFWSWSGYRLFANLREAEGRLRGRWRFSEDLSLVGGRGEVVEPAPGGVVVAAWKGEGRLAGPGWAGEFASGDVLFLPAGWRGRWASPRGATLVELALPSAAQDPSSKPVRLAGMRDGVAVSGERVLLRGAGWRLSAVAWPPGAAREAARDSRPPLPRMLSLLWEGRLRISDLRRAVYALPGDLFCAEKLGIPAAWRLENASPGDAVELRFVQERSAWTPPEQAVTSATGKSGAGWPPMLVP